MMKVEIIMTQEGQEWANAECPVHRKPCYPVVVDGKVFKGCEHCILILVEGDHYPLQIPDPELTQEEINELCDTTPEEIEELYQGTMENIKRMPCKFCGKGKCSCCPSCGAPIDWNEEEPVCDKCGWAL